MLLEHPYATVVGITSTDSCLPFRDPNTSLKVELDMVVERQKSSILKKKWLHILIWCTHMRKLIIIYKHLLIPGDAILKYCKVMPQNHTTLKLIHNSYSKSAVISTVEIHGTD